MSAESIARDLRRDMLRGVLPAGTRLKQTELAEKFGASRIPIRDALALLAQEGLVISSPNKGAQVLQMSPEDLREAYDLRLLLETDCLRHALPCFDETALADLRYALKRSDAEATGPDWATGDALFHEALYAPSNRPRQINIIRQLREACQIQIATYNRLPDQTDRWLAEHQQLVDLVESQKAEAAQALLRHHLEAARDTLLQTLA